MRQIDPLTGKARGFMILRRRKHGIALGFSLRCEGESWQGLTERLRTALTALDPAVQLPALARALVPFVSQLELRVPSAPLHQQALACARAELLELAVHRQVVDAVGAEHGEAVTLLLLAAAPLLTPDQRASLESPLQAFATDGALAAELSNVRAQLMALWSHAEASAGPQAC